jgi:ketosteroid isomerase-like protein
MSAQHLPAGLVTPMELAQPGDLDPAPFGNDCIPAAEQVITTRADATYIPGHLSDSYVVGHGRSIPLLYRYMFHKQLSAVIALFGIACTQAASESSAGDANAGIDSLNARIIQAYREHDPQKYGALYTDSAIFEWPAFNSVQGRFGMEAMARENWASLKDMDLKLTVASRRIAPNHATEIGAFEQSWRDSTGARMAEFGRYVTVLARGADGNWQIDRFFGFEDSVRTLSR